MTEEENMEGKGRMRGKEGHEKQRDISHAETDNTSFCLDAFMNFPTFLKAPECN